MESITMVRQTKPCICCAKDTHWRLKPKPLCPICFGKNDYAKEISHIGRLEKPQP